MGSMAEHEDYDPRYLAGIMLFNARDFFEAHEVWEDLWAATSQPDRRFYQALIQSAVALFHFGNGNLRGAARLYQSALNYQKPFFPRHLGLDLEDFWRQMAACFAELRHRGDGEPGELPAAARPSEERIPIIALDPPPVAWPDPQPFLHLDEE